MATRRTLLSAAVLGLAPPAVAMPSPVSNPDAELLELGAKLDRLWAEQRILDADHSVSDDELGRHIDAAGALVDSMEVIPAHTLDGLLVKARAVSWCNDGGEIDRDRFGPYEGATKDARIAASIVRDLLRRS